MGLLEIKSRVDEMQELYKIVDNGGALDSILAWVHERSDDWEKPFTNERFIDFTKEKSFRNWAEIVFAG